MNDDLIHFSMKYREPDLLLTSLHFDKSYLSQILGAIIYAIQVPPRQTFTNVLGRYAMLFPSTHEVLCCGAMSPKRISLPVT